MQKRADAENAIRHFALEWMHETEFKQETGHYPSFLAFTRWLDAKHKSKYLKFRSRINPRDEAEGWFESAIRDYCRSLL